MPGGTNAQHERLDDCPPDGSKNRAFRHKKQDNYVDFCGNYVDFTGISPCFCVISGLKRRHRTHSRPGGTTVRLRLADMEIRISAPKTTKSAWKNSYNGIPFSSPAWMERTAPNCGMKRSIRSATHVFPASAAAREKGYGTSAGAGQPERDNTATQPTPDTARHESTPAESRITEKRLQRTVFSSP